MQSIDHALDTYRRHVMTEMGADTTSTSALDHYGRTHFPAHFFAGVYPADHEPPPPTGIDFYIQNTSNVFEKLISPEPPKLHARSIHAPDYPACALLRNKGVRIDDMTWAGTFPGTIHAICYHCRRIRPEIEEQLDGYTIAVEQDSEPEKSDIGTRPPKAPAAAKSKARP